MLDPVRLHAAYQTALTTLLAERNPEGHWVGELSTSALSTATAIAALALVRRHVPTAGPCDDLIHAGAAWLAAHQNADGGWGDTVRSFSNISTTMLCRAALCIADCRVQIADWSDHGALEKCEAWLGGQYGRSPEELAEAVRRRYGKDRTFSVPILMTSALAGLVSWHEVPPLPFELACFPQSWFRFLRMPVVSYALPALIAIGLAVHRHRPSRNPVARLVRRAAEGRSLRVLRSIQPRGGGFLEATPLTSFVTMALAASGHADHPVAREAVAFLIRSVRPDGSWPIDSNLATWVTTLAVNALGTAGELDKLDKRERLRTWLLAQQYRVRHPYTGADPGGWAWTDLPGGVPDADDTPGALLALGRLGPDPEATAAGTRWLLSLQNRDGGWPTFCRGWGTLPFDRSGSDLTAHALRALASQPTAAEAVRRGLDYLARQQRPDGSWLPLWFGNQHAPDDENPTYGTARVLAAYRDLGRLRDPAAQRGLAWLAGTRNADGGWGGGHGAPSGMEETALAVEVLLDTDAEMRTAAWSGVEWLARRVEAGGLGEATPIGFYFAKLWYYEKLYPVIFTVAALGRALNRTTVEPNQPPYAL